jgi:hypothetical protein
VSKEWEKSSNGPDWTDVLVTMRGLEMDHRVLLTVTLTCTVGMSPGGILAIAAYSLQRDAPVMGAPVAGLSGAWPCPDHKTVTACLYAGLLRMDHLLSTKVWDQLKQPFTAA